jgi:quinol monooxygenase YgiN
MASNTAAAHYPIATPDRQVAAIVVAPLVAGWASVRILPRLVAVITWGIRIHIPAAKGYEVQRVLRGLLEPTRVWGGCLACHLYQDVEDPDVFALVQEWTTADDLERYLRSDDRRRLVAVLEMASRRPDIWVDTIVNREGLERLATLMGSDTKEERHG